MNYSLAAKTLHTYREAFRFINKGLHGDKTKMYPTDRDTRIEIAENYLSEKVGVVLAESHFTP